MSCGCGGKSADRRSIMTIQEGDSMAQVRLLRTARSRAVPGVGYARRGVIHEVPESMAKDLLKTGDWAVVAKAGKLELGDSPESLEPVATAEKPKPKKG